MVEIKLPTVTLQPNWPQIFRGEKVTLRCEIHGGGGAQWTYEWRPTNRNSPTSSEYRINTATESGDTYRCKARGDYQITAWSDAFRLTVRDKPRATLTADETIIPPGGSVRLNCSVDGSADWKFDWFRNGQQYSVVQTRGKIDPYGVISISEGGLYSCRGGRGDPVFTTETSNEISISSRTGEFISKPTVIQQPSGSDVYIGEKVTLRCKVSGGGGAQWTYEWRPTSRNSPTSSEYRINRVSTSDSGEYSCRAKGDHLITEWICLLFIHINLNKIVDKPTASLTANQRIIPLGGRVTLTCSVFSSTDWKFDWFRNGQQYSVDQTRGNIERFRVISISEGGLYSCRGGRGDPVFTTGTSNEIYIWKTGEFVAFLHFETV
uniref:Ig-like domain-containing protein n=1 Tax=Cyprinodon variegatus TaxID=28743 RepID=A0A3Q2E1D5_CYPVA